MRAREPDHVSDPLFFSMSMSQFPFGLVIPYSKKRIENLWNNNELNKLPDPKTHFIWIGTKNRELELINSSDDNSSNSSKQPNDVSLSFMSISYKDLESEVGKNAFKGKKGTKMTLKRNNRKKKEDKYLDISFDEEHTHHGFSQNQSINRENFGSVGATNHVKKRKREHKSFNCFK